MKTTALLVALATAFAATHADECATSQLNDWSSSDAVKDAGAACGMEFGLTAPPPDASKVCSDSKCLSSIKAMYSSFPDCTINGLSLTSQLSAAFTSLEQSCALLTGTTVSPSTTEAAPSPSTTGAASTASVSAAAVATAAVVAFYAQA